MINKITLALAALALVVAGVAISRTGIVANLGATAYDVLHQAGDIRQGLSDTLIARAGVLVGNVNTASLQVGSSTAMTLYSCTTATWNAPSIGTSSVSTAATSTDSAFSGALTSDRCAVSLDSATSSEARLSCNVSGSGTTTIQLLNTGPTALDLATGTAKVCITR